MPHLQPLLILSHHHPPSTMSWLRAPSHLLHTTSRDLALLFGHIQHHRVLLHMPGMSHLFNRQSNLRPLPHLRNYTCLLHTLHSHPKCPRPQHLRTVPRTSLRLLPLSPHRPSQCRKPTWTTLGPMPPPTCQPHTSKGVIRQLSLCLQMYRNRRPPSRLQSRCRCRLPQRR